MPSSGKTQNFGLSQYIQSDKPTWLGDYNGDMSNIDQNAMRKGVYDPDGVAKNTFLAINQKLTGYEKSLAFTEIQSSDSVAEAIGKLDAGTSDSIERVNGWRFFNALNELGLTEGSETMATIGQSMPNRSILIFSKVATNPSTDYPVSTGLLTVIRYDTYRVSYDFNSGLTASLGERWTGSYAASTGAWSGWKSINGEHGTWTPELVTDQGDEIPITNASGRWIRTGKQVALNLGFTVGEIGEETDGVLAVAIPSELYLAYSAPITIGQVRVAGLDAPANYDSPFVSNISRTQFRLSYHRPDGSWSGLATKHIKAGSSFGIQVVYEGA